MKTKQITLPGWANNSNMIFSPNSNNKTFTERFNELEKNLLSNGYQKLKFFQDLRGREASEKLIVKGKYWRGEWADPSRETYAIFYK